MTRSETSRRYSDEQNYAIVRNGSSKEITIAGKRLKSGESVKVKITQETGKNRGLGVKEYILERLDSEQINSPKTSS